MGVRIFANTVAGHILVVVIGSMIGGDSVM
jgi:F0F1-type ATP synthase membrane subunit a